MGRAVLAAVLLLILVGGASAATGSRAACSAGKVPLAVNGEPGVCLSPASYFRRTAADTALNRLVSEFAGNALWRGLAGENTVATAIGGTSADADRWLRDVFAAARHSLRTTTGGRELLGPGSRGDEIEDFAAGVRVPAGLERVRSTIDVLDKKLKQGFSEKKATASASAAGSVGTLDFLAAPAWRLDACPRKDGVFAAHRTMTLKKQFTSTDGTVSVEKVTVEAALVGHVDENARLDRFTLNVEARADDSRGGKWVVKMRAREVLQPGVTDPETLLVGLPAWKLDREDAPGLSATVNGRKVDPRTLGGSVDIYLERVAQQATAWAREDAERTLQLAFDEYYAKHSCNTIQFVPSQLKLKPGQTAKVNVRMQNTSKQKGDPEWKVKALQPRGVEVIGGKPKGKSKVKVITIRAPKGGRKPQSNSRSTATLTVDGVSIRGRGLDTLTIEIVDDEEQPPGEILFDVVLTGSASLSWQRSGTGRVLGTSCVVRSSMSGSERASFGTPRPARLQVVVFPNGTAGLVIDPRRPPSLDVNVTRAADVSAPTPVSGDCSQVPLAAPETSGCGSRTVRGHFNLVLTGGRLSMFVDLGSAQFLPCPWNGLVDASDADDSLPLSVTRLQSEPRLALDGEERQSVDRSAGGSIDRAVSTVRWKVVLVRVRP